MIGSMDLNASPVPEEDEETFERHEEVYSAPEEHIETGASIARRVCVQYILLLSMMV